jgi:hypothetical protein
MSPAATRSAMLGFPPPPGGAAPEMDRAMTPATSFPDDWPPATHSPAGWHPRLAAVPIAQRAMTLSPDTAPPKLAAPAVRSLLVEPVVFGTSPATVTIDSRGTPLERMPMGRVLVGGEIEQSSPSAQHFRERLDREGRSGPRYASPSRALLQPSLVRPPLQNVTCEATAAAAATVLLLTQTACRVQEMPWRPPRERLVSAAVPSQRAWAEAEVGHVHPVLAPLGRVAPASSSHGAAPSPPAQRAESPAEDVERVWG